MYDELIAEINETRDDCRDSDFIESAYIGELLGKAADAIEELTDTNVGKWIPVTERLPKYGDWILGIGPKKGYHVCEYRGISHFVYGGDSPWFSAKGRAITVTHWMPLPQPPKEEAT